jgi:magnesium-transporting ATPase (P-type)
MTQFSDPRIVSSIQKVRKTAFDVVVSLFMTIASIPILIWWVIEKDVLTETDVKVVFMMLVLIAMGFFIISWQLNDLRKACSDAALNIKDVVQMNEAFFLAEEDPSYYEEKHQKWLRKAKRLGRIAKWLE